MFSTSSDHLQKTLMDSDRLWSSASSSEPHLKALPCLANRDTYICGGTTHTLRLQSHLSPFTCSSSVLTLGFRLDSNPYSVLAHPFGTNLDQDLDSIFELQALYIHQPSTMPMT